MFSYYRVSKCSICNIISWSALSSHSASLLSGKKRASHRRPDIYPVRARARERERESQSERERLYWAPHNKKRWRESTVLAVNKWTNIWYGTLTRTRMVLSRTRVRAYIILPRRHSPLDKVRACKAIRWRGGGGEGGGGGRFIQS